MNKLLLKKYLNNTCSEKELEQVKQFLLQPESVEIFHEVLDEAWKEMEAPKLNPGALINYRQRLMPQHDSSSARNAETTRLWSKIWVKCAAILILPLIFGLYQLSKIKNSELDEIEFVEMYNPKGRRSIFNFSDGTVIYLGSNSKIRYPKTFSNTREIELTGEAFFKVKKDPTRPFIIHTNNLQTKVLGTSFKIEAFKGHPVEVSVSTGKVRVDRQDDLHKDRLSSVAVLTPGHLVNWDEKTKKATITDVSIQELDQWKDGHLTFNNQRLADVAAVLERCYNVSINISSNSLSNYRINTTCSLNEPINKIIDIMSKTGGFKYRIAGNQIIISKKTKH